MLETAIERIAKIVSREMGLKVVFRAGCPMVNLVDKIMYLPPVANIGKEELAKLTKLMDGFIDHECSHVKYTDPTFLISKECKTPMEEELLRGIEDWRVDHLMSQYRIGCEENIRRSIEITLPEAEATVNAKGDMGTKIGLGVFKMIHGFTTPADYKGTPLAKYLDEGLVKILKKKHDLTSTRDVLKMAREIIAYWNEKGNKAPNPQQNAGQQGGEGQQGKGTGKSEGKPDSGQQGQGQGQGQGQDDKNSDSGEQGEKGGEKASGKADDQQGQGEKGQAGEGKGGKPQGSPKDRGREDGDEPSETSTPGGGIEGGVSGIKVMSIEDLLSPAIEEEVKRINEFAGENTHIPFSTKYDKVFNGISASDMDSENMKYRGRGAEITDETIRRSVKPVVNPLIHRLERALIAKERAKELFEQKRGKLDSRMLYRVATGTSSRVFKKKIQGETRDVAVSLLVDCSGSMSGRKIKTAREAAAALSIALERLDIDHEVAGFDCHADANLNREISKVRKEYKAKNPEGDVYKDADSPLKPFNRYSERINHYIAKPFGEKKSNFAFLLAGANNTDGESVMIAARRLAARKESKKVLIVLSDGYPASEGDNNKLNSHLREVVERINKSGIHTIGIGINSSAVSSFYPDWVLLNDIEALPREVIRQLERILVKGEGLKGKKAKAA